MRVVEEEVVRHENAERGCCSWVAPLGRSALRTTRIAGWRLRRSSLVIVRYTAVLSGFDGCPRNVERWLSRAFGSGRVEDWRAGLGRCLCSLLTRPFVCECHNISTMPRFQPPPRRTQRADSPHYALLCASHQGLWDLSCTPSWYQRGRRTGPAKQCRLCRTPHKRHYAECRVMPSAAWFHGFSHRFNPTRGLIDSA